MPKSQPKTTTEGGDIRKSILPEDLELDLGDIQQQQDQFTRSVADLNMSVTSVQSFSAMNKSCSWVTQNNNFKKDSAASTGKKSLADLLAEDDSRSLQLPPTKPSSSENASTTKTSKSWKDKKKSPNPSVLDEPLEIPDEEASKIISPLSTMKNGQSSNSWITDTKKSRTLGASRSFDNSTSNLAPQGFRGRARSAAQKKKAPKSLSPKRSKAKASEISGDTVWSKYQKELSSLLEVLGRTQCRYVRCIIPNGKKLPGIIDQRKVIEQIRCTGVVATVRLSRAIYPNSMKNHLVRGRFGLLWDKVKYPAKGALKQAETRRKAECEMLLKCVFQKSVLDKLDLSTSSSMHAYVVGKTRTYFSSGVLEYIEAQRVLHLDEVAVVMQRQARRLICQKAYRIFRNRCLVAILSFQRCFRGMLARRRAQQIREERRRQAAAAMLQRWCRGVVARLIAQKLMHEKRVKEATDIIQRWCRGGLARIQARQLRHEKRVKEATPIIQRWCRGVVAQEQLRRLKEEKRRKDASITIQKWFRPRCSASKRILHENRAAVQIERHVRGYLARLRCSVIGKAANLFHQLFADLPAHRRSRAIEMLRAYEKEYSLVRLVMPATNQMVTKPLVGTNTDTVPPKALSNEDNVDCESEEDDDPPPLLDITDGANDTAADMATDMAADMALPPKSSLNEDV